MCGILTTETMYIIPIHHVVFYAILWINIIIILLLLFLLSKMHHILDVKCVLDNAPHKLGKWRFDVTEFYEPVGLCNPDSVYTQEQTVHIGKGLMYEYSVCL